MSLTRRVLGSGTIRSRLYAITAVLVLAISGIIFFSARSSSIEYRRALVNNVAGREPVYVERYVSEVLLESQGVAAGSAATRDSLVHTADALLDGGAVVAVQGNDETLHVAAQTDPTVRAKLTEFDRLVGDLVAQGDKVATLSPNSPTYRAEVAKLVALSHVTANVGHDAVGRMTALTDEAVRANAEREMILAAAGILLALGLCALLSRSIVRRLHMVTEVARANAAGDLTIRSATDHDDEIGQLALAFNEMADHVSELVGRLETEAARDGFGARLVEAFEMVDHEHEAYEVIERAMLETADQAPTELLIADSSRAHLRRMASTPGIAAPGCGVESPFACVAVRRGTATVFESSEALNSCRHLAGRPGGACSAVCVPVSFMGKALGVVHATGPDGEPLGPEAVDRLSTLAAQAGSRIGTVRVFQQTQLQATTDGLTGLMNRRTLENELRSLVQSGEPFALAMADLDHFKKLNDTFGHVGGDRALQIFANTVRGAVRSRDIVARYGGEEFVFVFPGVGAAKATEMLDRIRVTLAAVLTSSESPRFTASFGLTESTSSNSIDELLALADSALMTAKAEGRDRVVVDMSPARH